MSLNFLHKEYRMFQKHKISSGSNQHSSNDDVLWLIYILLQKVILLHYLLKICIWDFYIKKRVVKLTFDLLMMTESSSGCKLDQKHYLKYISLSHERMKYFRCNIFGKLASNEADFKQNYYNNGLKYKIYNNGLEYKICISKLFQQFMGFSGFDHLYR